MVVIPLRFYEVGVGPLFYNCAIVENDDMVCINNDRESVAFHKSVLLVLQKRQSGRESSYAMASVV